MAEWTVFSAEIKEGNDSYDVRLRGVLTGAELAALLLKKDDEGKLTPDFGAVQTVPDEVQEAADNKVGP